jgi:hypothetical protein
LPFALALLLKFAIRIPKSEIHATRLEQLEKDRRAIMDERSRLQADLDTTIRYLRSTVSCEAFLFWSLNRIHWERRRPADGAWRELLDCGGLTSVSRFR